MTAAAVRPDPVGRELPPHSVEVLREGECWRLLGDRPVGRLAVIGADGGPDIFPVNALVRESAIFYRSGGGAKMRGVAADERVAFEVDGRDDPWCWSVVVRGTARRLDRDDEIEASGVLDLVPLFSSPKEDFVEITPIEVTGRRFRTDFPEPESRSEAHGRGSWL